jgi:glucose/arabinose dehydrogenase
MMRVPSVVVAALLLCLATALPPERVDAAVYWTRVVGGLNSPIEVTHAGDGSNRMFVVQQGGKILIVKAGVVQPTAFLDISGLISAGGERGLLGLAFHPQYATNRQFYVDYTRASDGATVIARYTANAGNPDVADAASATILLTIAQPFANHNGGALKFGPDGYLYIGMGDGGDANDPAGRAQDKTTLLGKILRIDVNSGSPYAIPPTNPFPTGVGGRAEIFAIGMRNPWRFSFDRATGDFWIGDVGQNAVEEVDRLAAGSGAGANFGWRMMEGNQCTGLTGPVACNAPSLTAPVIAYSHSVGCSVTGGFVYRGSAAPDLVGKYLYGDYCSGRLWAATGSGAGPWVPNELSATGFNVSTFGEDEAGELYFANHATGEVFQFVGTPAASPQLTLNTKSVSFADTNVGSTSGPKSVNVTNTGGGTLSLTALTPGGSNIGEFTRGGTCAVGTTLAAGQSCTVSHQFAPATSGNRSANLTLTTNGGTDTFNLGGTGVGAASPGPRCQRDGTGLRQHQRRCVQWHADDQHQQHRGRDADAVDTDPRRRQSR